jgi:MOSC domain-containing protein
LAGERGLAGDRIWAVVDAESGKVVSAKRPKVWLTMLECAASSGSPTSMASKPPSPSA